MDQIRLQHAAFGSGQVPPEVLPPRESPGGWYPPREQQYVPPQPRSRPGWAFAPATYLLVGINCLVYLAMLARGVSFWDPTTRDLINWGANNSVHVLIGGEWWRLVTAMFVHVGIIHIATNMWCLWNLGLLAEPLMGPFGVIATYLLTGFAGNLLSVLVHPGLRHDPNGGIVIVDVLRTSAGASGAVFGLAGVLIVLLNSHLLPIPKVESQKLRRSVIYFALLNLAIGLFTAIGNTPIQIDNMAHLGGFLSGLALGVPLVPKIGAAKPLFERRRLLGVCGLAFVLVLVAFGLHSFWR